MKREELDLICKDICSRIPYGVICRIKSSCAYEDGRVRSVTEDKILNSEVFNEIEELYSYRELDECKPYLRPMSSMTKEELNELENVASLSLYDSRDSEVLSGKTITNGTDIDWLNSHHFDYRGLIPMGMALPAPEKMYKFE